MKRYGYVRVSTVKQSIERQIRNIKAEFPDAVIVTDEYTGTKLDRPGWMKIYKAAKAGDVIVFDSVSRMSRDADEGFQVYEELFRRGVELIFLKERHIDTATYKKAMDTGVPLTGTNVDYILEGVNKYLLSLAKEQIRLAFDQAEKEVEDLHQRTREGIETARLNGKQIGQVKGVKLTTKKDRAIKRLIQEHNKDFDGHLSDVETMALINGLDEIKTADGVTIKPHVGVTKGGNQKCRFINRATFYKYKRELKEA